ncbi:hypothetical protein GWI33_016541 [Rhynchophorus ferrugineus]|uniref:Uncharacterized protein n=1 Tax=Rhynchophorus ferrugineus TaxID=354439 RepID=A0A834I172_RHYFE|nr:hypothetical protein GWI33_016541 [Rhynchophorus ferrugineus]
MPFGNLNNRNTNRLPPPPREDVGGNLTHPNTRAGERKIPERTKATHFLDGEDSGRHKINATSSFAIVGGVEFAKQSKRFQYGRMLQIFVSPEWTIMMKIYTCALHRSGTSPSSSSSSSSLRRSFPI